MNCLDGIASSFNQWWNSYKIAPQPALNPPPDDYTNPPNSEEISEIEVEESKEVKEDRNELHIAYKGQMKRIIILAVHSFIEKFKDRQNNISEEEFANFVHEFVEERFKPSE